jgi:sodium-dependent dicarboxylate transporter 2/3/5
MVAGFMAVTAVLSMWVSNTATTAMMLPIAMSVTTLVGRREDLSEASRHRFHLCLLLGIAYAASVGGIGTLIGTPPNVFLAGFVQETYGREISFAGWMLVGIPLVAVFIPLVWWMLTSVIYPIRLPPLPGGRVLLQDEIAKLGRPSRGEWATFVVFITTAFTWMTRRWLTGIEIAGHQPLAGLSDAGIAVIAGLALFVIPVRLRDRVFVMDWATARRLPWGVLILFGGGLSLAAAVQRHGVAEFIGAQTQALAGLPELLIIVVVITGVIFLTELTSNTATTATLLPLLAGIAPVLGVDPIMLLVPAAVAASCAFMMPVATPPNAIVFGSGDITIPEMCRAGFWLNVIGIVLVTILAYTLAVPVLGGIP